MSVLALETRDDVEAPVPRGTQELSATICNVVAMDFGKYMTTRGMDGASVLQSSGVNAETLSERYSRFPIQQLIAAFEISAQQDNDCCLGLHFGEWFKPSIQHACNFAINCAPDLRQALNILQDHRNLVAGIPTQLNDHGAFTEFSWTLELGTLPPQHVIDYNTMRTLKPIHKAAGREWSPLRVNLAYEKPKDTSEHYRLLGPNVHFDQPANSFWIDSATMTAPMPDADPDIYHMAQNSFRNPFPRQQDDTNPVEQLRQFISDRLGKIMITLIAASEHLGMNQQQLRRLLIKHDTCFQCVLDDTRKAHAAHYLCETDTRFTEIAFLLGFSDQSAFSRAAKRWFGMPPKDMRRSESHHPSSRLYALPGTNCSPSK